MRHVCVSTLFAAVLFYGARARAQQTSDDLARRDLLAQAEAAREGGDHARAIELATRAAAVRMTPSLALLLAQEHSAASHPIEALSFAAQCVRDAEADAELHHRRRILAACTALTESLSGTVARVTVRVPAARPPELRVFIQHTELREPLWGIAYPVAPGAVTIDATTGDGATFHQDLTLAAGETREVLVHPALPPRPDVIPPRPLIPVPPSERQGPLLPRRLPGLGPYAVMGAGVLGLGLAGLFYGLRQSAVSDRDRAAGEVHNRCVLDELQCDYSGAASADGRARSFNLLTNAALGVAVLTLTTGATWWVVSYVRRPTAPPRVRASFSPGPEGFALSLEGTL